jgi:hypothetical protein
MTSKMTGRILAAAFFSLTAAGCQGEEEQTPAGDSLATQEAKAEQQCIEGFGGIKNCATGRASLARDAKGIAVSGLADVKTDGFSSEFSKATSWNLTADLGGVGAKGQGLTLAARDGAQVVSSIRVGIGAQRDQVFFAPSFTGSPGGSAYRMNVYQNGRLVLGQHYEIDYSVGGWWYNLHIGLTRIDIGFKNHTSIDALDPITTGACMWTFRGAPGAFSIDANGKKISGDYIEFIEEVADGAYPYTSFSGIDVKAAASGFNIVGESIVQEK